MGIFLGHTVTQALIYLNGVRSSLLLLLPEPIPESFTSEKNREGGAHFCFKRVTK